MFVTSDTEGSETAIKPAVAALQGLGLTEYQSRTYAGLYRIQRGTAREVAEASGVPRARVYDTLNALHNLGVVDIQQSSPREYLAVPVDTVIEVLEAGYRESESRVRTALADVRAEERVPSIEQEGVWVVTERDRVSALERNFISEATSRVVYGIASMEAFDEETATALEAASEEVEVIVETVAEQFVTRFEVAPHIEVMTPRQAWENTPELEGRIGRILVVDDRHVLVSTVLGHDLSPGSIDESAVWTSGGGAGDGLVQAFRNLMLDRVENRIREADREEREPEGASEDR